MTTNAEQFVSINERIGYRNLNLEIPVYLRSSRFLTSMLLILTDLIFFMIAGFIANSIRALFVGNLSYDHFIEIMPFIILSQVVFALRFLYPAIGISPVNEVRQLSISTTVVFLFLAAITFFLRNPENYSRINLALTWVFGLVLVPLSRALLREILGRIGLYGEPVVVIGYGKRGKEMVTLLQKNVAMGLRPVMVIDSFDNTEGRSIGGVPVVHMDDPVEMSMLSKQLGVNTAVILTAELPNELLDAAEKIRHGAFKRLILIPDREQIGGLGIIKYDLGMVFGLEVKRNLFNAWEKIVKRITDITMVLFGGLLIAPLFLLISIVVKLNSKGPLFYGHTRVGIGGSKFKAWKFRTMVPNANQVLNEYLEDNPELRQEWEATFKLQDDPRVTSSGRILRKLSLDELPQLWNVLKGEMSLVGPRPIVDDEVSYYGDRYELYSFVMPGITGLWQVSGRNDTSYEERVRLDEYYVRNWSIWMDIYILARTAAVVLTRTGAY